ncbi:hypothetical protein [Erythrobacter oryzae]|uniref:hypothetical protein n=1 Tax=Erythrobacter oryzae TaxID=3019556 RepID=UPI002552581C|nr:hypothetical protein [Erythrobacter sp. COR-2]
MSLDAVIVACGPDRDGAARLTDGLGAAGLMVKLVIAGAGDIPDAPCRVLAITRSPDCNAWLASAAHEAAGAGRAIAVRLEPRAEPPVPLPTYDYLVKGVMAQLIGKACLSDIAAAIRAIQQNTFPPSATARWRMVLERLWVYLVGFGAIVGLFGYFVPWDEVGHWFDFEEQAAWEALQSPKADCAAFDAYLDTHPDGRHADAVRDARANPDMVSEPVPDTTPMVVSGPLLVGEGYASREAALAAARDWALADAQRQCGSLAKRLEGQNWTTQLGSLTEQCRQTGGGWLCAVEGAHACRVEVPTEKRVCRLGGAE